MSVLKLTSFAVGATLLLAGGTLVVTTPAEARQVTQNQDIDARLVHKFSDDDLLLAVLFGTGSAATALGIHVADDIPLPADYDQLAQSLVSEFRNDQPDVTDTALSAFRGGNPIGVHDQVQVLQRVFQETYIEGPPRVENGTLCAAVNLVLAGNVAVALNVAVAVAVAFVTWVVTYQVQNESEAELISARLSDLSVE